MQPDPPLRARFGAGTAGFHPAIAGLHPAIAGFHPAIAGFHPAIAGFHLAIAGFHLAIVGLRPPIVSLHLVIVSLPPAVAGGRTPLSVLPRAGGTPLSHKEIHTPDLGAGGPCRSSGACRTDRDILASPARRGVQTGPFRRGAGRIRTAE
jgi:hypothetical protein